MALLCAFCADVIMSGDVASVSYDVQPIHTALQVIYTHFVRIYDLQGQFVLGKKNWRNSHFLGLRNLFLIFRLPLFV